MRPRPTVRATPAAALVLAGAAVALFGCSQTTTQAPLTTSSLPADDRTPPRPVYTQPQSPPAYSWNGNPQRQAPAPYAGAAAPAQNQPTWQTSPRPPFRGASQQQAAQPYGGSQSPAGYGGAHTVEVMPGDTLYSIARRNAVTVTALAETNHLTSPAIQPGQKLYLPSNAR